MEKLTTYRAQGKTIGLVFLFKYDLKGRLKAFIIEEGELDEAQKKWLFSGNFPATESLMWSNWIKDEKYKKVFTVKKSPADLSFEALWEMYDHKMSKQAAMKAFAKMKEQEIIECFISIPVYKRNIEFRKIAQANLSTYINGRYYENEYK